MSEPIIALLAAVFGGAGLKLIESLLSRAQRRSDVAKEIRDELRAEVTGLKEELDSLELRLDDWRRQYYALLAAFNELAMIAMSEGLHAEVTRVRQQLEQRPQGD